MQVDTKKDSSNFDEKFDVMENKVNHSPVKKSKTIDVGIGEITITEGKSDAKKLKLLQYFGNPEQEVFCVKFDPEDSLLATSIADGSVRIYNVSQGNLLFDLNNSTNYTPTTCLRWRPPVFSAKSKNILVATNADGSITHWHAASGKQLSRIVEKENHVLALDYTKDGTIFATGGKDAKIRIYDEATKALNLELSGSSWQNPGHSNRIFCVKFIEDDQNILMSGGWDCNVHFWDMREKKSIASFFGPSVSGDSLDYRDGIILAGSYRSKEHLQLWDYKTKKMIKDLDWQHGKKTEGAYVYATQFSKSDKDTALAGCSGINEVNLFDVKDEYKNIATISNLKKGCFTVDYANKSGKIAFSGGAGLVYIMSIV